MVSALAVALPQIGSDFGISPGDLGLVETSYLIGSFLMLIPIGKIADKVGLGRIFVLGVGTNILFMIGVGLAPNYEILLISRFFQGISMSLPIATGNAILTNSFPGSERGKVLGYNIASVYIGLSLGPYFGGLIVELLSWHYILFILSGVSLFAFALAYKNLDFSKKGKIRDLDLKTAFIFSASILISWLGVTLYKYSVFYILLSVLGLITLIAILKNQYKSEKSIIDIKLFLSNKAFRDGNIVNYINYASSIAVTYLFSLYLQYVRGYDAHAAGLVLIAQPIMQAVFTPITGRLSDKISPSILVLLGMISSMIGIFISITLTNDSNVALIYSLLIFFGLGYALFSSANTNQMMSSVERHQTGVASSIIGALRTLGMLTSISIASSAFNYFVGTQKMSAALTDNFLAGMRVSFVIFLVINMVGVFIAYRLFKNR
jgi:MFS family permease